MCKRKNIRIKHIFTGNERKIKYNCKYKKWPHGTQIVLNTKIFFIVIFANHIFYNRYFKGLQKLQFLTKISMFDTNFVFWQKVWLLTLNSSFCQKLWFLTKIWIFHKNLDFWQKFGLLTKIWIFDKNLDFWQKNCLCFRKFLIFDKNFFFFAIFFDFWQKYRL